MASKKTTKIQSVYYIWRLLDRNGTYYADGRIAGQDLGRYSLGTPDREVALKNLAILDAKTALENGKIKRLPSTVRKHVEIEEGWRLYFSKLAAPDVSGGASKETLRRYRSVRDRHIAFSARRKTGGWERIGRAHLRAYSGMLHRQEFAPRTIYLELTTIKSVLKYLIDERYLPRSRRVRFPIYRPDGSDTFCYQLQHVEAMLKHCDGPDPHWLRPIIHTLSYTGLRINELVGLRRSDLSLDDSGNPRMLNLKDERASQKRKQIGGEVRRLKGRRGRMVPIDSELGSVLRGLPIHPDGKLFHTSNGTRITARMVREAFIHEVINPLKDRFPTPPGEIGFEHGRLHSFRHFFVSRAFICGASEGDVREWVGHRNSKIIELYRHLRPKESRDKLESLDLMGRRRRSDVPPGQCS